MMRALITARLLTLLLLLSSTIVLMGCSQKQMESKVRQSLLVALILPQYDSPQGGSNSTSTPDERLGTLNELSFWYEYVYYIKQNIEEAGYQCVVINHGSIPSDPRLLPYSELANIIHLQQRDPSIPTASTHHPKLQDIAMSSINYAMELNPACIILLRHHDFEKHSGWAADQDSSIICNQAGGTLASYIAQVLNRRLMNNALPNGGSNCGIVLRQDKTQRDTQLLQASDKSYIPAVATAITYLNNPDHVRFLNQQQNAIYYAQCIASGIINYMNSR